MSVFKFKFELIFHHGHILLKLLLETVHPECVLLLHHLLLNLLNHDNSLPLHHSLRHRRHVDQGGLLLRVGGCGLQE